MDIYASAITETVNAANICVQTVCLLQLCNIKHCYKDDLYKKCYLNLWVDIKGLPNK